MPELTDEWRVPLADEAATVALGKLLGQTLGERALVFLEGELGAGKTTLTRGILRSAGFDGAVKSPTYTLVEPYELPSKLIYHFDLYRLSDPEELEYLGFRDYLTAPALVLVEWPSKGAGLLPQSDISVRLQIDGRGRCAYLAAGSDQGCGIIASMRARSREAEF